jgi:hypothetical protein
MKLSIMSIVVASALLVAASLSTGCVAEQASDEELGAAQEAQIDPGVRNYVLYGLLQGGVQIGKVLVTGSVAGAGFDANREYWYLATNVNTGSPLTFSGGTSQDWSNPPSGLGTLSFVTQRTPTWTSGTPRGTMLLESNALTGERVGINWGMSVSGGVWSGSITWWHSNTNNIFGPSTTNTLSPGTPSSGTWYYYVTSPL